MTDKGQREARVHQVLRAAESGLTPDTVNYILNGDVTGRNTLLAQVAHIAAVNRLESIEMLELLTIFEKQVKWKQ